MRTGWPCSFCWASATKERSSSLSAELSSATASLNAATPGDRVPPLDVLGRELGLSVTKLREQLEVARQLGLVEVRPRSGIKSVEYNFLPAIRKSLLFGLAVNASLFKAYGELRNHTEAGFFKEAVALLSSADKEELRSLVAAAQQKLQGHPVRIPHQEHRQLHVGMFRRLENPFVIGLLEAYWEAYEAVELNVFAFMTSPVSTKTKKSGSRNVI